VNMAENIRLFLIDGTVRGTWKAELDNWTGMAYKIPWGDLEKYKSVDALRNPGVYFFLGQRSDGTPYAYVGEGEDVWQRITQKHTFNQAAGEEPLFWTEVIALVDNNHYLDKAKIKFLENKFYIMASEAGRYELKNATTPTKPKLSEGDVSSLEKFSDNARLLFAALGHILLEPKTVVGTGPVAADPDLLYYKKMNFSGIGKMTEDGFWVLKGSRLRDQLYQSVPDTIRSKRKEYATKIDDSYVLQTDVRFGSPSYAAMFVCGTSANGLTAWKNDQGTCLKDINDGAFSRNQENPPRSEPPVEQGTKLYFKGTNFSAMGMEQEDGFILLKGSKIRSELRESCNDKIKAKREELISSGKIKDWKVTEDILFTSPSAAAACVVGGSENGLDHWKDASGKSLNDLRKEKESDE